MTRSIRPALRALTRRRAGKPAAAGGELRRRAFAKHSQRQHALAPEVCYRDAGDGLVAGPSGCGDPHTVVVLARAQLGKLTFGSGGGGSPSRIAGELFRSLAAIDIAHLPYRGNPPLLPDCSRAASATAAGARGRQRTLAVTSPNRPAVQACQRMHLPDDYLYVNHRH